MMPRADSEALEGWECAAGARRGAAAAWPGLSRFPIHVLASDRQAWTPLMILGLTRVIIRVTRDSE